MKRYLAIALLCSMSFSALADRNFYGILSAGYVQNEIEDYELDKASYKLGIGYEITPQWYLEAGYQGLGEESASGDPGSDKAEFSSLYLSALGKARGQYGELFYRLGVMRVDADIESASELSCGSEVVACTIGDSLLAGAVGVGFDMYVHHSIMLRFEAEYIKGEQDYSANAAYIGVRYNF
ncbi:outer membrane beta-barrel protein [Glaciecola siphonariae]|uniref:Outer membrane beta-barrel protein n=1 Tax=Glaciecola siphonariae TaxID=521012 RepID=A0ABV9LVW0_9ALTE